MLVPVTSCSEAIYVFNLVALILKQKASPNCGCLNLHDVALCIVYCTLSNIQLHILTGYDTNSKFGTNLSALKLPAVQLLSEFGKSLSSPIPFKMKSYAKLSNNLSKYSNQRSCTTMDDLRYKIYHGSKFSDLLSLPLTSADLYLHFLRYMYTA